MNISINDYIPKPIYKINPRLRL